MLATRHLLARFNDMPILEEEDLCQPPGCTLLIFRTNVCLAWLRITVIIQSVRVLGVQLEAPLVHGLCPRKVPHVLIQEHGIVVESRAVSRLAGDMQGGVGSGSAVSG